MEREGIEKTIISNLVVTYSSMGRRWLCDPGNPRGGFQEMEKKFGVKRSK
jgi:hypothetical protein